MIDVGQEQNRREKNKTATREAITQAALDLLRSKGIGGFTVENVADAAGISRRTFFNYFSSVEAAIASSTESFLDLAIGKFRERPLDEPILDAAQNALTALADPMHLSTIAEVYALAGQHDAVGRFQLEIWNDCTGKIIDAAKPRFSASTDELYVHALVGSVIACGKAAMEVWFARNGAAIDEASLRDLRALMIQSIAHLGSGFAQPEL